MTDLVQGDRFIFESPLGLVGLLQRKGSMSLHVEKIRLGESGFRSLAERDRQKETTGFPGNQVARFPEGLQGEDHVVMPLRRRPFIAGRRTCGPKPWSGMLLSFRSLSIASLAGGKGDAPSTDILRPGSSNPMLFPGPVRRRVPGRDSEASDPPRGERPE